MNVFFNFFTNREHHNCEAAGARGAGGGEAVHSTELFLEMNLFSWANWEASGWILHFTERNTIWGPRGDLGVSPDITGGPLSSLRGKFPLSEPGSLCFLQEEEEWANKNKNMVLFPKLIYPWAPLLRPPWLGSCYL